MYGSKMGYFLAPEEMPDRPLAHSTDCPEELVHPCRSMLSRHPEMHYETIELC